MALVLPQATRITHVIPGERAMAEDFLEAQCSRCLRKPAEECDECFAVVLCSHCMRIHKEQDH